MCLRCSIRVANDLADILRLACEADPTIQPSSSGGGARSVPGSRPPLTLDALDPELALVRLVADDPSSDVPILVVLEDWERIIREDRGLSPYGVVSEARLAAAGPLDGATWRQHTHVTLTGVVGFLKAHHDWCMTEPSFDIAEYARQIRLCRRAVARWDADLDAPGWRVPCPTITPDGDCGNVLKVRRGDETAYCRACDRDWELNRLLAVAGQDADVWVDVEAAATLAGVHERTIRKWVSAGKVARRGQLVRVHDVRQLLHTLTAS